MNSKLKDGWILYHNNTFFHVPSFIDPRFPFLFCIGGRGIGKTYSILEYINCNHTDTIHKFLYLRRRDTEIKITCTDFGNPFKVINNTLEIHIEVYTSKGIGYFYKNIKTDIVGYAGALSNFSTLRGMDLSDVELIFFDEFCAQKEARDIPEEADAFFNLYETINRNRELLGKPPCICILCSNAVSLNNDILAKLDLIRIIDNMIINNQQKYQDKSRGIRVLLPNSQDFIDTKKDTALYKLTAQTNYSDHALQNKFIYDSFQNIKKCPIDEYIPFIGFGNIYIYRHKRDNKYYASRIPCSCDHYDDTKEGRILFRKRMYVYKNYLLDGTFQYQDFHIKTVLTELIFKG